MPASAVRFTERLLGRRQGLLAVVGQVRRKRVVGRDMGIVRLGQRDRDAHARLALRALVQMDEDVLNPDL